VLYARTQRRFLSLGQAAAVGQHYLEIVIRSLELVKQQPPERDIIITLHKSHDTASALSGQKLIGSLKITGAYVVGEPLHKRTTS